MCEITHLHSTRRVFNSRRGRLRINTKSIKTPAGWGTPLGEITPLPRPGSSPLKTPPRSQHFGLPASALIGAKAADGPQVTVEPWPLIEPCYATAYTQLSQEESSFTIRDVILTCAQKLNLIYRTEPNLESGKQ